MSSTLTARLTDVHESFTKSTGEIALEAHARGEHAKHASLVCRACRESAR